MLISVVVIFATTAFDIKFSLLELPVKSFLEWIVTVEVPAAKEIMVSIEGNASERGSILRILQCFKSDDTALREPGTEQIFQVLRVSLAVHTYALNDAQIREPLFHVFRDWELPFFCSTVSGVYIQRMTLVRQWRIYHSK